MAERVHRERAVTHHGPDDFRLDTRHRQPGAAGMPQAVEIKDLAFVVRRQQEVALLSPNVLVRSVGRLT